MLEPGSIIDIGDHTVEIKESPAQTGDRYRQRIVCEPGGGPGIRGRFPHIHPRLIETFHCVSGEMKVRVGREISKVAPGHDLTVDRGVVHGFINSGTEPLVIDNEVIFPDGYRPEDDLMVFASHFDRLRQAHVDRGGRGDPPMLQLAVLVDSWPGAVKQPGLAGWLMRPLATLGRLRGYSAVTSE